MQENATQTHDLFVKDDFHKCIRTKGNAVVYLALIS